MAAILNGNKRSTGYQKPQALQLLHQDPHYKWSHLRHVISPAIPSELNGHMRTQHLYPQLHLPSPLGELYLLVNSSAGEGHAHLPHLLQMGLKPDVRDRPQWETNPVSRPQGTIEYGHIPVAPARVQLPSDPVEAQPDPDVPEESGKPLQPAQLPAAEAHHSGRLAPCGLLLGLPGAGAQQPVEIRRVRAQA